MTQMRTDEVKNNSLLNNRFILLFLLLLIIGAGIALRFLDLTDPPLDFIPWRQMRSATIARSMYYQQLPDIDPELRNLAVSLGHHEILEPHIFETIVATTYRLAGGEYLWIARIWGILFWLIGGLGVFQFTRRITSIAGASVSLAYYLILPFAVISSRAFLPDVLMAASLALGMWALLRWLESEKWSWAIATAIILGFTVLVKVFAVYPVALACFFGVLSTWKIKQLIKKPQVWVTAAIMAIIPGYYYLFLISGSGGDYLSGWVLPYRHLLTDPAFFVRWISMIHNEFNFVALLLSLLGLILMPRSAKRIPLALMLGYLIFGMTIPSLIISHTYYNIVFIPIVAIPLCVLADTIHKLLSKQSNWRQITFAGIFILAIGFPGILARNHMASMDYRPEILGWIKIGRELPSDGPMIGFTHDYNLRLMYYGWRVVNYMPQVSDMQMRSMAGADFELDDYTKELVHERLRNYDYFVVTLMSELNTQTVLKTTLYEDYSIYQEGDGYIIFDLRSRND